MNKNISPGRGLGHTSFYADNTGLPEATCKWYVDNSDHDKLISYWSAVRNDNNSVMLWARRREAEKIDLQTGEQQVVGAFIADRGLSAQISIADNYILAGPLLLQRDNFSIVRNFEKELVPGSASGHELANIPVDGGFLYLAGNSVKPPRELYFINTETLTIHYIGGGYSRIVGLPGAERYFAIRDGQLVCENLPSGETIWQRNIPVKWSKHTDEKYRVRERIERAGISCTKTEVMLFISGAGFYRFDAYTGKLLHHLDTHLDSVGWQGARYFRECDGVLSASDLYYVVHCDERRTNAIRAYSFNNNRLIFEQSAEGGYEFPLFIAGDLFFFVDSEIKAYIARDRYSGELVWQSEDYLPRIHFGLPVGNKIFLYGGAGHMICYEWNEPYESPHRINV